MRPWHPRRHAGIDTPVHRNGANPPNGWCQQSPTGRLDPFRPDWEDSGWSNSLHARTFHRLLLDTAKWSPPKAAQTDRSNGSWISLATCAAADATWGGKSTAGAAIDVATTPKILREGRPSGRVPEERSFPPGIVDQTVPKYFVGSVARLPSIGEYRQEGRDEVPRELGRKENDGGRSGKGDSKANRDAI